MPKSAPLLYLLSAVFVASLLLVTIDRYSSESSLLDVSSSQSSHLIERRSPTERGDQPFDEDGEESDEEQSPPSPASEDKGETSSSPVEESTSDDENKLEQTSTSEVSSSQSDELSENPSTAGDETSDATSEATDDNSSSSSDTTVDEGEKTESTASETESTASETESTAPEAESTASESEPASTEEDTSSSATSETSEASEAASNENTSSDETSSTDSLGETTDPVAVSETDATSIEEDGKTTSDIDAPTSDAAESESKETTESVESSEAAETTQPVESSESSATSESAEAGTDESSSEEASSGTDTASTNEVSSESELPPTEGEEVSTAGDDHSTADVTAASESESTSPEEASTSDTDDSGATSPVDSSAPVETSEPATDESSSDTSDTSPPEESPEDKVPESPEDDSNDLSPPAAGDGDSPYVASIDQSNGHSSSVDESNGNGVGVDPDDDAEGANQESEEKIPTTDAESETSSATSTTGDAAAEEATSISEETVSTADSSSSDASTDESSETTPDKVTSEESEITSETQASSSETQSTDASSVTEVDASSTTTTGDESMSSDGPTTASDSTDSVAEEKTTEASSDETVSEDAVATASTGDESSPSEFESGVEANGEDKGDAKATEDLDEGDGQSSAVSETTSPSDDAVPTTVTEEASSEQSSEASSSSEDEASATEVTAQASTQVDTVSAESTEAPSESTDLTQTESTGDASSREATTDEAVETTGADAAASTKDATSVVSEATGDVKLDTSTPDSSTEEVKSDQSTESVDASSTDAPITELSASSSSSGPSEDSTEDSTDPPLESTTVNTCGDYGCCGDGKTPSKGPDGEGCTCDASKHGCCPDRLTESSGPDNEGCPCKTKQFGCCPNSTDAATGPKYFGCDCSKTPHGCCQDGVSVAFGPNHEGCDSGAPLDTRLAGESCALPKERGPGRNYSVQWYFDMSYGGCIRFWYGGREGNANRFETQEQCERTCVSPEGAEVCSLPKVTGPCEGKYPSYFYNKSSGQCEQFEFGGCLGNNNRFDTIEQCQQTCDYTPESTEDPCDQPVSVGPCKALHVRFYFNKLEGRCKQFIWGGCSPNKNNFLTMAQCMQTCKSATPTALCKMNKSPGPCLGNYPRWYFDNIDGTCKEFIYTGCQGNRNQFVDKSTCERTCNQTQVQARSDICSHTKDPGPCRGRQTRWYFDTRLNSCQRFTYGGCEGNLNNFQAQSDCERTCLVSTQEQDVCLLPRNTGNCSLHGLSSPEYEDRWYYDITDKRCHRMYYTGCNGNGNNFKSIDECHAQCGQPLAPALIDDRSARTEFKSESCSLPRDSGPGRASDIKYWYDATDGVCKQFYYGGIDGNSNRFNSKRECEISCWNSQDICSLKMIRGPCSGNFAQWYYNSTRQTCEQFFYSGCSGNANRFSQKETCQSHCKKKYTSEVEQNTINTGVQVNKDASCLATVDPGDCQQYLPRYYYDSRENLCRTFIYTGCGGSLNRFDSRRDCEARCVVSNYNDDGPGETDDKETICRQSVESGPCMETHSRWFYDPSSYTCVPFVYGGCGGNKNRFKKFETCINFCTGVNDYHRLPDLSPSLPEIPVDEVNRSQRPPPPPPPPQSQSPSPTSHPSPPHTSFTSPSTETEGETVTTIASTTTTRDPCRYECADSPFFSDCSFIVEGRYCSNPGYANYCCKSCLTSNQLTVDQAKSLVITDGSVDEYYPREEGHRLCFYRN